MFFSCKAREFGKERLETKKMPISLTPAISDTCFSWTGINNRPFTGAVYRFSLTDVGL